MPFTPTFSSRHFGQKKAMLMFSVTFEPAIISLMLWDLDHLYRSNTMGPQ
jgi:hypothetical protein